MLATILAWTALAAAHVPGPTPLEHIRSTQWINTRPLAPADLRGHVIVLDFWTFG